MGAGEHECTLATVVSRVATRSMVVMAMVCAMSKCMAEHVADMLVAMVGGSNH